MNGGSPSFRVGDDAHPAADVPADLPGAGTAAATPSAFVDPFAAYAADEPDEPAPVDAGWWRRIALIASVVVLAVWIGTLLWFGLPVIGQLDPLLLAGYVAELASVPILLGVAWLVFLRTSRAEAARFGASARAMRAEAAALERTVAGLGRRLDDNRRALAEQIAAIATLGDATEQRFASIAETLGGQIEAAGGHARQLADAASQAQASIVMVLSSLPRAQAGIEDTARLLDRSGAAANEHAAALDARLVALAEHGRDADTVAGGAAQRLAEHIQRMDETGETAGVRLEAVTAQASAEVDALLDRTAAAIDGSRQGIAAQGEAMLAMIRAHQAALDHAARDSAEALGARIDDLEAAIDRLAGRLDDQRAAGDRLVGDLAGGIGTVEDRLAALHAQGVERSQLLAASISALGGSADAMTEALRTGEAMAQRTIGTTETLLIALDSAAREIDETLPDALSRLDAKIGGSRQIVVQARPELLALVTAAESTHDAIEAIAGVIADQRRTLDQLQAGLVDTLSEGHSKADALGEMVDDTIRRANRFADEAAPRLVDSLLQVRETAAAAADKAREALADVIPEAAAEMEAAAAAALARASGDTVERQIRALSEATENAVAGTTRAVERLERHVQSIAEQTALVETRLEDVRAEQDETMRDSFSRRASLLIESLNSASIDITKHFAPDVADSAWAAYLKGDRGVFTRRAVRIVDAGIARDIARHYDADPRFREAVNRYIHDFEAMLRDVLAQRDGSPLGVTLLSSDIGKLYVALAQAIERLR